MKTLIAYASKYGCTEKCAAKLAEKLGGNVELADLKSGKTVKLADFDKIIIGSSIYVGRVHKEVTDFCIINQEILKNKPLGLFICGSQTGEPLAQEMKSAYPAELQSAAIVMDCFGGEYSFSKMSFMDKTIVKVVAKTNKDTSTLQEDKIDQFSKHLKAS